RRRGPCAASGARPPGAGARASGGSLGLLLLALDALEQGAEVASAEALIALPLNELEEERPGLGLAVQGLRIFEEDLQHVAAGALAIDQDAVLAQQLHRLLDGAHAAALHVLGEVLVVGIGGVHELDAA